MYKLARAIVVFFLFSTPVLSYALPDLDEKDIRDSVDVASFIVGADGDVGTLIYIVDRTSGNCFATIKQGSSASGITAIKCEYLQAIPAIANYMQTGTL